MFTCCCRIQLPTFFHRISFSNNCWPFGWNLLGHNGLEASNVVCGGDFVVERFMCGCKGSCIKLQHCSCHIECVSSGRLVCFQPACTACIVVKCLRIERPVIWIRSYFRCWCFIWKICEPDSIFGFLHLSIYSVGIIFRYVLSDRVWCGRSYFLDSICNVSSSAATISSMDV